MSDNAKVIVSTVLITVLYGLMNYMNTGLFLPLIPFSPILFFGITSILILKNKKQLSQSGWLLFLHTSIAFIAHPFIWEIIIDLPQQEKLSQSIFFDIMKIASISALIATLISMIIENKKNRMFSILWGIGIILNLFLFLSKNYPFDSGIMYLYLGTIAAIDTIKNPNSANTTKDALIGIGIISFINIVTILLISL